MMMARVGLPLAGRRVLVTRAREQAVPMTERLQQLGASVVHLPAIEIVPVDPVDVDAAIQALDTYDWIVFTSANTVEVFAERLEAVGRDRSLTSANIAAVGSATAERLRAAGLPVDLVPERFVAEAVVTALTGEGIAGKRVLLPQADIARETLAVGLRDAGAEVDTVVAYATTAPENVDPDTVRALLASVDIATFASPSAVRNVIALAGGLPDCDVVCIGPITEAAAREAGMRVVAVAETHTIDGMIDAVVRFVEQQKEVPDGQHP